MINKSIQRELTTEIRVRYPDCDPMGVVHHSRYYIYFEIARMELYRKNGGNYNEMESSGEFFVVVNSECKYLKSAHFDDLLQVTVKIVRITRVKILQEYTIYRGDELIAKGKITLAMVNREGNIVLIPDGYLF